MNPTKFNWVDPLLNVDGSAVAAGEITGYNIGIRPATGNTSVGNYPLVVFEAGAALTSAPIPTTLAAGSYFGAVMAVGPVDPTSPNGATVNSAWSAEVAFTIAAVPPAPQAPTGFSVG